MRVADEMTAEERRKRLLHGLNATSSEEVALNFSHLAHAIGMDAAESLIGNLVAMDGLLTTPYSRVPKLISDGICIVNRLACVTAIERVQVNVAKSKIDKRTKS